MTVALLAFAGFLIFDVLSSLKLKDLVSHATYFELFIECSKTDQYREGAVVKRHGRWRSENAKDGYVEDSLESRLAVSIN